jgi:hypothetical protein
LTSVSFSDYAVSPINRKGEMIKPTPSQLAAAVIAYDDAIGLAPAPSLTTRIDAMLAALIAALNFVENP